MCVCVCVFVCGCVCIYVCFRVFRDLENNSQITCSSKVSKKSRNCCVYRLILKALIDKYLIEETSTTHQEISIIFTKSRTITTILSFPKVLIFYLSTYSRTCYWSTHVVYQQGKIHCLTNVTKSMFIDPSHAAKNWSILEWSSVTCYT